MRPRGALTPLQARTLRLLREAQAAGPVMPSLREIGRELGLRSKGHVSQLITALVAAGMVRRLKNRSRAIEVVRDRQVWVAVQPQGMDMVLLEVRDALD